VQRRVAVRQTSRLCPVRMSGTDPPWPKRPDLCWSEGPLVEAAREAAGQNNPWTQAHGRRHGSEQPSKWASAEAVEEAAGQRAH